jgi:type IV pilus assembly protein PilW
VQSGGTSATACDAGDDNGSPIPTLTRLTLEGSVLKQQPMVEGIENIQFEYGLDTDGDGDVDRFDTALSSPADGADTFLNDVSDADSRKASWGKVVSVRVALVARSSTRDASLPSSSAMILVGDQGQGSSGYTPSDGDYFRKQFTQTFQIRNRVRS